mmetsp:Transcript_68597/g.212107  ORF Transcript_68597/g.212107 Transcript_68597/m.212107 type:complete len:134 (-) Transcript_68597:7-408(-)
MRPVRLKPPWAWAPSSPLSLAASRHLPSSKTRSATEVHAEGKGLSISRGPGEAVAADVRLHAFTTPAPAEGAPEGTAQPSAGSDGSERAVGRDAPRVASRPKAGVCFRRSGGRLGTLAARGRADAGILAHPSE